MDFAAQRAELVMHLAQAGIGDLRVQAAFGRVPREEFVPPEHRASAYADAPLPIGHGQTISQPLMVALMLEALDLQPGHRVLEVGTGSGYQAALLAELGARVVSVERIAELAEAARGRLVRLGYADVEVVVGDGSLGWPPGAPYDRVVVAAAAPRPPAPLTRQLADGGRLVIPTGTREMQALLVLDRVGQNWRRHFRGSCRFVPLVGAAGWPEGDQPP
ncbi:MAG: protein-L-isoaspartate(D-aspartate) O-methyltransferase, partial [Chloroflexi bacterium]|nr:protein-L-isoaspartate(D-aspartate) O-methyltransferase [Chloroflexota bacterium]